MAEQYLKDAVLEYLKDNPDKRLDSVDIVSYFKLRADFITDALWELEEEGHVTHHYVGLNTHYEVNDVQPIKNKVE